MCKKQTKYGAQKIKKSFLRFHSEVVFSKYEKGVKTILEVFADKMDVNSTLALDHLYLLFLACFVFI